MYGQVGAARRILAIGGFLLLAVCTVSVAAFDAAAGASVNLDCPAGTTQYKVEGNPIGGVSFGHGETHTVGGQTFVFTKIVGTAPFTNDTFSWTSTIAASVVYVKGGVGTNTYPYSPAATSGSGLHPPLNSGGQAPEISHVTFCVPNVQPTTTTTVAPTTTTTVVPTTTSTTVAPTTTTTEPPTTTTTTEPPTTTTTTVEPTTTTTVEPTTTTTVDPTTTTTLEPTTTSTTVASETSTTVEPTTTTTVATQGSTTSSSTVAPTTVPSASASSDPHASQASHASTAGTLPYTGSSTLPLAIVGGVLFLAGVAFLFTGLRRARRRTEQLASVRRT